MSHELTFQKAVLEHMMSGASAPLLYARHVDVAHVDNPISWLYDQALALKLEGVVASAQIPLTNQACALMHGSSLRGQVPFHLRGLHTKSAEHRPELRASVS